MQTVSKNITCYSAAITLKPAITGGLICYDPKDQSTLYFLAPSVRDIVEEYIRLLTTSSSKQQKRLGRLRLICSITGLDFEKLRAARFSVLPKAVDSSEITDSQVIAFFKTAPPPGEMKPLTTLKGIVKDFNDTIRKAISGELTKALNSNDTIYDITWTEYVSAIVQRLSTDPITMAAVLDGAVIVHAKGSMAHRRSLQQSYNVSQEEVLATLFGGDNDCGIAVRPDYNNAGAIREAIIAIVEEEMRLATISLSNNKTIITALNSITSVTLLGKYPVNVKCVQSPAYRLVEENENGIAEYLCAGPKQHIVYTKSTPRFLDDAPTLCAFDLQRLVAFFECSLPYECLRDILHRESSDVPSQFSDILALLNTNQKHQIKAEILDIATPCFDDPHLPELFDDHNIDENLPGMGNSRFTYCKP